MKSAEQRIREALELVNQHGGIDGDHHKQWLLDQIVRSLTGGEAEYRSWVEQWEQGEDGPRTYEWETGIIP